MDISFFFIIGVNASHDWIWPRGIFKLNSLIFKTACIAIWDDVCKQNVWANFHTKWTLLFILLSMSWGIIFKRKLTYSQGYKESYDLLSHKSRNIIVSQVVIRKITINLNKFYKRIQLKYTHWRESWTNSQLVDHQKDLQVINNKLKWLSLAHLKFDKQYLLSSIALTDFFKKIFLWRKETECAPYFYDQRWNTKITFNWSFLSRNKKILPFNILFN